MSLIPLILASDSWNNRGFGMDVDDEDIVLPSLRRSLLSSVPHLQTHGRFHAPVKADEDSFQVNVDVQQFAPDEITVKIDDEKNIVTVEGKHEEKADEHGYISRHFVRKYALPEGHDLKNIQSNLSSDGVLTITAPKLNKEDKDNRIIPIQQTGRPYKNIKRNKSKLRLGAGKVANKQLNTPTKRNTRYK